MICQSKTLCGKENTRRTALVFLNEKVNNVLISIAKHFLRLDDIHHIRGIVVKNIYRGHNERKYENEFEKILRLVFTRHLTLHLIYIV